MESVFQIPTPTRYTNPVRADDREGPWPDPATACAQIGERRTVGLVVDIQPAGQPVVKYWWPGPGLEDADLVPYLPEPEQWQPLTPQELPTAHQAAAGLSQRDTILYLFQHLSDASGNDYGYAWLTEDEQLIVTEDAE